MKSVEKCPNCAHIPEIETRLSDCGFRQYRKVCPECKRATTWFFVESTALMSWDRNTVAFIGRPVNSPDAFERLGMKRKPSRRKVCRVYLPQERSSIIDEISVTNKELNILVRGINVIIPRAVVAATLDVMNDLSQ